MLKNRKIYASAEIKTRGIHNTPYLARKQRQEHETRENVGVCLDHYGIFEVVQSSTIGPPSLCVELKGKATAFVKEVEDANHGITYRPPRVVPWILPEGPETYKKTETLFEEIKQCLHAHLETPKPEDLTVIAAWILHTWIMERFESTPYLFFYGAFECGKTRALEIIQQLSFRGWLVTSITSSFLYRPVQEWKPTLLLDESETFISRPEILGILNAGYKRGMVVPRQIQNQDGTWQTEWFDLFCPKVLAGTEDMVRTTKSRCVTFKMAKATRKIPVFIDKKTCAKLRNKLLRWRFDQLLSEPCEQSEPFSGCRGIEEKLSGRLLELFLPLIQVTPPKYQQEIIEYAQTINAERLREMGLSEEVLVLSAILECQKQGLIQNRQILIKHVTDRINTQASYNEQWPNSSIGRIVGRLGFERVHTNKGNALLWNEKLVEKLKTDPRYATAFTPIEIEDKDTLPHLEKGSLSSQGSPDPEYLSHTEEVKD